MDTSGGIALSRDDDEIEEAIRLILATAPGERPMRPAFGCAVHEYVFAPANAATAGSISYAVRTALDMWEPRIGVDSVGVRFDSAELGILYIDIHYHVRGANSPRNLVFPFYTIPSHDGPQF
jgi:phage baseplate assembly protein W